MSAGDSDDGGDRPQGRSPGKDGTSKRRRKMTNETAEDKASDAQSGGRVDLGKKKDDPYLQWHRLQ